METDTVVHVESDLSSAEIYKIFVCSPKINVKFDNGKTLRAGMKLVEVAQTFGDDFKASWTPEEIVHLFILVYMVDIRQMKKP